MAQGLHLNTTVIILNFLTFFFFFDILGCPGQLTRTSEFFNLLLTILYEILTIESRSIQPLTKQ